MTTNVELIDYAKRLNLKDFKGVFMRDELSSLTPLENECGIYNLEDKSKCGSHWVAWFKKGNSFFHFCSYGSSPSEEFKKYSCNSSQRMSHTYRIQEWDDVSCGEYCILFLYLFQFLLFCKRDNENNGNLESIFTKVVLFLNDLAGNS